MDLSGFIATVLAAAGAAGRARGPDGGPLYVETDPARTVVEPWNAATAALFLVLAAYWLARLRGRYRRHAFLTACMPLLIVGGVGGTVYHAFRAHRVWLAMDWMPIVALALAGSVWLWMRVLRPRWLTWLVVPPFLALPRLGFAVLPVHAAINVSYASLAVLVLAPAAAVLVRTRGAHWGWPAAALACFVTALAARTLDAATGRVLPMGSHWLWHVFGAAAGHCIAMYFYRLQEPQAPGPPPDRPRASAMAPAGSACLGDRREPAGRPGV